MFECIPNTGAQPRTQGLISATLGGEVDWCMCCPETWVYVLVIRFHLISTSCSISWLHYTFKRRFAKIFVEKSRASFFRTEAIFTVIYQFNIPESHNRLIFEIDLFKLVICNNIWRPRLNNAVYLLWLSTSEYFSLIRILFLLSCFVLCWLISTLGVLWVLLILSKRENSSQH